MRIKRKSVNSIGDSTRQAVDGIREMIVRRKLWPGQQLRQADLAIQLGMSRSPVREALKALETEGMVLHAPNQGYFTASWSAEELGQIYLMRRLIEGHVLRAALPMESSDIKELAKLNRAMKAEVDRVKVHDISTLNREFHFLIFRSSNLDLVVRELERLWRLSDAYRTIYLTEPSNRSRVIAEHDEMIEAIEAEDAAGLIRKADQHRRAAEESVVRFIGGGRE